MTCEQAELRMAELLAGEIAPGDRSELEKHLLDCATCRGDFEVARAGAKVEWADVSVPKEVIEATLASFREPAPVVRLLRWATAAAAAFGLAALLIASSRSPKPEQGEERCSFDRPQMLATMQQDPVIGSMVCQDEDGRPAGELGLKSHEVTVEILDGIAKTTVEENFENHTNRRLEGTFNFPLPSDASISRLALEVNGKIEEGTCLERERAREVFEGIVRRMQDPALLEWQPGGFFKCRVFPIEPKSTKRVIVAYTQALPCFQGKMTYVYPLASEKTRTHAPEEVRISVQARFSGALAKIGSPSHHLEVQRKNANEASMSFRADHYRPNNDFVVTMEPEPEEVRVVSHKPDGEDGYFACFATPRGGGERTPARYAFVLDASASTSAPRLEVAKRLVRAMMERKIDGDRFEVLAHHIDVARSGEVDLRAANTFMDGLQPIGGSDVLKALQAAGDAEVIYIGKGAPTFGEMETSKILDAVKGRRIRTVAVGSDANVALLERLGGMMRVSPNDDVAKRVAEIAATLGAPVLSEVKLEGGDAVYDVVGVRDLFHGERLVVSGRYRGPTAKLAISGRGYRREVDVAFPMKEEGNNYVRRLWAQRKVADLLAKGPAAQAEVTDLGVKYQIMTPYTSFLVLETEQMWKDHQLKREVQKQDELLAKNQMSEAESAAHNIETKREVTRKIAQLLELSYAATDQKKYDRTIKLCEEILKIDPHYPVAKELKEDVEKLRHKEEYGNVMAQKLEQLKRLTDAGDQPVIPKAQTVRFPNREEWGELSKRITDSVIKEPEATERPREVPKPPSPPPPPTVPAPTEPPPVLVVEPLKPDPKPRTKAPVAEDSRAQAVREAYEEQLRRDRQAVTIKARNGALDATIDEFSRQTGWNMIVGDRIGPGFTAQESARLEDWDGYLGLGTVGGRYADSGGRDVPNFFTMTGKVLVPGAPITDPPAAGRTWRMFGGGGGGVPFQHDSDMSVFVRQMEVELAQLQELSTQVDESRAKLVKSMNEKALAGTEEERRRYVERNQPRIDALKAELAYKKGELDRKLNTVLEQGGLRQPKGITEMREEMDEEDQAIRGKLQSLRPAVEMQNAPMTAIVDQLRETTGLNIHIAGPLGPNAEAITLKTKDTALDQVLRQMLEPRGWTHRVRDGVVLIVPSRTADAFLSCVAHGLNMQVASAAEDGRLVLQGKSASPGQICAVTRAGKFVSMVRVDRISGDQTEAQVLRNISVGRVLPGDRVDVVTNVRDYLAALPVEVRMDLASRASQQAMRAKMGLKP